MIIGKGLFAKSRTDKALQDLEDCKKDYEKVLDAKFQKLYTAILEDLEASASKFRVQVFKEYIGEDKPFKPAPHREIPLYVLKNENWCFSVERQSLYFFNNSKSPWNFASLTRLNSKDPKHRNIFSSPGFIAAAKLSSD